jgi:HPt (histidine-containing phosphotransfer) domain-containing protein
MRQEQQPESDPLARWRGIRVLVADSSLSDGEELVQRLNGWGLRAVHVNTREDALRHLRDATSWGAPYPVAMIAGPMSAAGGEELGATIRADARLQDTHLIMLGPVTDETEAPRLAALGFAGWLAKPVDQGELRACLASTGRGDAGLPVFDAGECMERMLGDTELADTVASAFLGDLPRQLKALDTYLRAQDVLGATRQAHSLKGAASNVSAEALRALAWELEQAGKAGELAAISARLPELVRQAECLREALELWLARIRTGREAA